MIGVGVGVGLSKKNRRVLVKDSFNRGSDSTTTIGTADTGQTWAPQGGSVWGIRNNKAYCVSDTSGQIVTIGSIGKTSYDVSMDVTGEFTGANLRYPTICLHYVDASNYLFARIASTAITLLKIQSASQSTLVTASITAPTNGSVHNLKVLANDGVFTLFYDGAAITSYTLTGAERTLYLASTVTGMRLHKAGTPTGANCDFDNFKVTV